MAWDEQTKARLEAKTLDLRWWGNWACSMYGTNPEALETAKTSADIRAALAEIERLQENSVRLAGIVDQHYAELQQWRSRSIDAETKLDAAEQRIAKLEEALRSMHCDCQPGGRHRADNSECALADAEAALGEAANE